MSEEIIQTPSPGIKIREYCDSCNAKINHIVLHSLKQSHAWEHAEAGQMSWEGDFQIIQCKGCDLISFRKETWFSEDYDPEAGFDGKRVYLYPERSENWREAIYFQDMPQNLKDIYHEVLDAYNQSLYLLCAGGIRAIIEGICNNLGIKGGIVPASAEKGGKDRQKNNLQGKIFGLLGKGKIRTNEAEFLHELRFLGNAALHELQSVSKDELNLSIDIVEHVLRSIYVIGSKGDKLKQLRLNRENPEFEF